MKEEPTVTVLCWCFFSSDSDSAPSGIMEQPLAAGAVVCVCVCVFVRVEVC